MKLKHSDFLSFKSHSCVQIKFGNTQMGLGTQTFEEFGIPIKKFLILDLLLDVISKRIELQNWDWSQIEGNLL